MTTYVSPFTGDVVQQTDVTYYALAFSTNQTLHWPATVNPPEVPAARIIDCTPSTAGLSIALPPGGQGSNGTDILFRNFGAVAFTVTNSAGGASVSIGAGVSKYFYLSDNSTEAGVWQNVTFGTGTSSADAASLQGAGLTTLAGKLAVTQTPITVTSTPTITDADRAETFVWTSGNGTFTLPAVAGLSAGWWIGFRNNGTGALNIVGSGASQINNQPNITVNPGDSGILMYQSTTGNFFTVGLATPSNVTFTSATYDVDAVVGSTFSLVSYAPIIQTYVALSGARTTDLNVLLPATTQLYILVNDTGAVTYSVTFQISGSVQAPIPLGPGTVATVLSDGNFLYVLSQNTTSFYYAADGSAAVPSFSFINDTATGMYLDDVNVLGLTANGVNMMLLDNSAPLTPEITTPAEFTALKGIKGGTF
jgi:hypothetical protein